MLLLLLHSGRLQRFEYLDIADQELHIRAYLGSDVVFFFSLFDLDDILWIVFL